VGWRAAEPPVSAARVLGGRRPAVQPCPWSVACPRAASAAGEDAPDASGGLALAPSAAAGLAPSALRALRGQQRPGAGWPRPGLRRCGPSCRLALRHGADGAFHVRWRLSSCRPRPGAASGPAQPRHRGCLWVACGARDHPRRPPHASGDAVPALPGARSPRRPPGCSVDAAPLVCVVVFPTTPPWTPDARRLGGLP
jgi:hypothetical protein